MGHQRFISVYSNWINLKAAWFYYLLFFSGCWHGCRVSSRVEILTQLNIRESYGMTETATMLAYNHYIHPVVGSVVDVGQHIWSPNSQYAGNVLE
jgi:hypothetical protein